MGLGLGLGIWWPIQTSIIPGILRPLKARATYFENVRCTTATLQKIENIQYTAPIVPVGFLASYPGASVAYSLRNLINTTTNVVRVRRSSDNAEQNFTSNEITDGTLTIFTGINDGFVTIWYDQSGNSNNASQTAAANQPKLVSSGVVELDNGKPCLNYDTTGNDSFDLAITVSDVRSVFQVWNAEQNFGANTQFILGSSGSFNYHAGTTASSFILSTSASSSVRGGANYINSVAKNFLQFPKPLTQCLVSMISLQSNGQVNRLMKDRSISGRSWRGKMTEIILYPTDESTNNENISNNINEYYDIYTYRGNITGGLLNYYPNAIVAYSLRNLAVYDNGVFPVIRVRRSSDNSEQDFLATGITDGTLETFVGTGNDGFISTWYNQQTTPLFDEPNNAIQTSAILQPKIVELGNLILEGSKPCILYNNTGNNNLIMNKEINNVYSIFQVLKTTSVTGNTTGLYLGQTSGFSPYSYLTGASGQYLNTINKNETKFGNNYLNNITTDFINTIRNTNHNLITMIHTDGVGKVGQIARDRSINGRSFQGKMQEIILFSDDKTSTRLDIQNNINNEYTIY